MENLDSINNRMFVGILTFYDNTFRFHPLHFHFTFIVSPCRTGNITSEKRNKKSNFRTIDFDYKSCSRLNSSQSNTMSVNVRFRALPSLLSYSIQYQFTFLLLLSNRSTLPTVRVEKAESRIDSDS